MFWKKKTSDKDLFEYESSNKRANFRLESEDLGPALATYKSRPAEIIDISAGGISFKCAAGYKGETGFLQLKLPGKVTESISLPTEVVRITDGVICHCKFLGIKSEAEEKIHQYVLFRQIAAKKEQRPY